MLKTGRLIVKTVGFLLLATLLIAFYSGEDMVSADSLTESGKVDKKIDNGLNLALEAIRIAGNHKEVKGKTTVSSIDNEIDQNEGFSEKNTDHDVEDKIAERPKKTAEMHNPLITEPIKIQKKHREKIRTPAPIHYAVKIPANKPWTKTNVYLKENDIVKIHCKGKVMPGDFEYRYKNTSCLADGYHFTRNNFTVLANARYMAAIGKIGNRDAFYIGSGRELVSYVNGPLYLGINDLNKSVYTGEPIKKRSVYWKDNTGYFEADIYVYRK
ncbi:MAG: hypothetical protein MAG551_01520 [Candidatus Scalindua arabica]|uniref:Uncharacterized protein n=1 Tax=Candidatus Scalindua arabica TaxID=1127984 RepID=A0A941W4P6_9BACT|nr:hypothetical protein [Candidatus Scalindua arabica]